MTWEQLGDHIKEMSDEERLQTVNFVEPYDDDFEVYPVAIVRHATDKVTGMSGGEIKVSEAFLCV